MHPRQPRGGFYASGRDGNFERINSVTKSYYPHKGGFNDGDVFVEAGRLAAEYLVSQGMLPPNVLSLRLNDNCNVVGGVVGGFRKQGESVVEGGGGRASALNRLGNNVDGGMSWRRKPGFEEFGQKGSGRRRGGFRGNGFDWGHDFRRNEYWNDRYRGGVDFKDDSGGGGDDDGVTRERDEEEEQQQEDGVGTGGGGDGGDGGDDALQKLDSNEIVPKSEDGDDLDAEIEKVDCVSGELESEQKSSGAEKDTYNMEMEFGESSIVLENASGEVKEVQERDVARADDDDNMEKSSISKNLSVQSNNQENMSPSRVFTDLISLCKSVKVPTRIRSSRTKKNLKADHHHDDDKDMGSIQGPDVIVENESVKGPSSGDLLSEKTYDLEHTDSDIVKVEPVQDVKNTKEFDTLCNAEEVQPIGFQSREDGGFMHDNSQKSSAVPEYGSCSTMAEERGEKRAAEAGDIREETKRLREWLPVLVPRTGEYFVNSNRIEIKESLGEDEISLIDKVTSSDQESLMSSQFTLGGDKPSLKCSEGKQSLPSSFRTCDLNLIEASEVHENHVDHPTLIYPPGTKAKKDVPVDISLPMSHTSVSGKFSTHSTSGKEIEVIDLENDSAEEEKPVENMERKTDTMFQGLEGFTNHAQNTGDINDVQDGYGLMISELLATDFPNCSSVPSDINSVHNEIDLHNVPEPLIGEDDSIYMSLGEIPLSFLRSWEQPPSQDYQKPF